MYIMENHVRWSALVHGTFDSSRQIVSNGWIPGQFLQLQLSSSSGTFPLGFIGSIDPVGGDNMDDSDAVRKDFRTALITIIAGVISACGTIGVAYLGGFFDVAKTDAASRGSIDLEKLKFSNELVKGALATNNPANSLLFYADIGLLEGLSVENVKSYADRESQRLKGGGSGPSLLPSFDKAAQSNVWIDREFMAKFAPNAPADMTNMFVSTGNFLLAGFGINSSRERLSMFLGQIAYETGNFNRFSENANWSESRLLQVFPTRFDAEKAKEYAGQPERILNLIYANRVGNGDEASGDGWRFRGRGFLFTTGRANYAKMSEGLGIDLVQFPEMMDDPNVALLVAALFWHQRGLNELADAGDVEEIARKVNGTPRGAPQIRNASELALKLLSEKGTAQQ
jgi:predicted chitinase